MLLSFPPGTWMFRFPGSALLKLFIHFSIYGYYPVWVAPFGYPRFIACLRLSVAFRSSLRPSSALGAKASSVRPF